MRCARHKLIFAHHPPAGSYITAPRRAEVKVDATTTRHNSRREEWRQRLQGADQEDGELSRGIKTGGALLRADTSPDAPIRLMQSCAALRGFLAAI